MVCLGGYVLNTERDSRTNSARNQRLSARDSSSVSARAGPEGAWLEKENQPGEEKISDFEDLNFAISISNINKSSYSQNENVVEDLFRNNAPARFVGENAQKEEDLVLGLELAQEKHDLGLYEEAKDLLEGM